VAVGCLCLYCILRARLVAFDRHSPLYCAHRCNRPVFSKVSAEAKDLLNGMLSVDPQKRLSASECLVHPWITGKAHANQTRVVLSEVQEHMMQRIERRRRKAHPN
jgi:serine/threonine protein kinase